MMCLITGRRTRPSSCSSQVRPERGRGPVRADLESGPSAGPGSARNLFTAFIAWRAVGAFQGHRPARGTRGPDADRRDHRRQHWQPDCRARDPAPRALPAERENLRYLLRKELAIGVMNGVLRGLLMGFVTPAALADLRRSRAHDGRRRSPTCWLRLPSGVVSADPLPLRDATGDGSSILLTAITDSMGFLIFPGPRFDVRCCGSGDPNVAADRDVR